MPEIQQSPDPPLDLYKTADEQRNASVRTELAAQRKRILAYELAQEGYRDEIAFLRTELVALRKHITHLETNPGATTHE